MAINEYGLELPADSDEFDPSGDLRDLGNSLADSIVVPVANDTARDALTIFAGLLVNRLDTGAIERYDGTNWQVVPIGDTGWLTLPLAGSGLLVQYTALPQYRVFNGCVYFRGSVKRTSGDISSPNVPATIGTIPSPYWPTGVDVSNFLDGSFAGANTGARGVVSAADGTITATPPEAGCAWVGLSALFYPLG